MSHGYGWPSCQKEEKEGLKREKRPLLSSCWQSIHGFTWAYFWLDLHTETNERENPYLHLFTLLARNFHILRWSNPLSAFWVRVLIWALTCRCLIYKMSKVSGWSCMTNLKEEWLSEKRMCHYSFLTTFLAETLIYIWSILVATWCQSALMKLLLV